MKILRIGVGSSVSNVVDRIAKENLSEVNCLKVDYILGDEPIDKSIPLVNLNLDRETSNPTAWTPDALGAKAEDAKDVIREAIKHGLELD